MTLTVPTLHYRPAPGATVVDLDRLIASRMLIQANSGAGKSRAVRQLLEETHGRVQHLVIDPEGEFNTLRERFGYVLAAVRDGDVAAHPKTARVLCRKLVELGASAVLDIYELPLDERREFVRLFLTELMGLPRALWRPILVVIDEAHVFAPERGHGESVSLDAVTTLCTAGRKRGFCAVLATQRISKLHKDAAAELLNKLIGRVGLDVDVKRAGDELGFDKEQRQPLKSLPPGEFFVYGPAISNTVTRIRTGDVRTTHPEPGVASAAPPSAPSAIRELLEHLRDIPQEAEAEARTIADLEKQNRELQGTVRRLERGATAPAAPQKVVERVVVDEAATQRAAHDARIRLANETLGFVTPIETVLDHLETTPIGEVNRWTNTARVHVAKLVGHLRVAIAEKSAPAAVRQAVHPAVTRPRLPDRQAELGIETTNGALGKGERVILTAIAQLGTGATISEIAILTGYKASSRKSYVQRLRASGYLTADGYAVTPAGMAALGTDFEPLPTGSALRTYWLQRLTGGEKTVLDVVVSRWPNAVPPAELEAATGYKASSRKTYVQRLSARRLVVTSREGVKASPTLFD